MIRATILRAGRRWFHPATRRMAVVVVGVVLGCGGGSKQSAEELPQPEDVPMANATKLTGYVVRLKQRDDGKIDTLYVEKAAVETEPFSDQAHTDAKGSFTLFRGVVQRSYRVKATSDDLNGRSALVSAVLGRDQGEAIFVVLGSDETPWPPPIALVEQEKKRNRIPSDVRSVAP